MSNPFRLDSSDVAVQFWAMPGWLADRFLQHGEKVTWVCGPRFNPSWERYVTHLGLFFLMVAFGIVCNVVSGMIAGEWPEIRAIIFFASGGMVLASIFVLGIFSGYFTRLVVTDQRLFILQGREMCRSWNIDQLPRSLVRFGPPGGREPDRAIDLDAVKAVLGGTSDKFVESGKILAFRKQVESIKAREDGRL
jgi:hypothetical protein